VANQRPQNHSAATAKKAVPYTSVSAANTGSHSGISVRAVSEIMNIIVV
jgi:hypothetical protein